MRVVARLVSRLDQRTINPLAAQIGETHKRSQVPALFGEEYSFGKWGQSGHISSGGNEILYVTLVKDDMQQGAEYVDHFEGPDRVVWSSQNQTAPGSLKGTRILDAPANGHRIHLWARRTRKETAFVYCGLVVPLSHEGSKPMSVTFRLLTPLTPEMQNLLITRGQEAEDQHF